VVIQALEFKPVGPQNQWVDMMFLTMLFILERMKRVVPSHGITIHCSICAGPESLAQTFEYRVNKRVIRMVLKELMKYINFDWCYNCKKISMTSQRS
jgi:hypothetical protein